MNDYHFSRPSKRPSIWQRLFGGGGEPEFSPAFEPPEYLKEPEPAPAPAPPPPPPASRTFHFSLPSEKPQLAFGCAINVSFEPNQIGQVLRDSESAIKQDVYNIACRTSSRLSLTEHEQLGYRITDQLHRRSLAEAGLTYWGRVVSVTTKASELELVRTLEQRRLAWEAEQQEDWMLKRRIKALSSIFEDPRIATIWWFAQHQDQLEELPLKAQLFSDLGRWFNPRQYQPEEASQEPVPDVREDEEFSHEEPDEAEVFDEVPMPDPTASTDGQLLDQFLLDTDEAGRASIGIVLSKLYRDNGRNDLADRIQQYAQPSAPTGFARHPDFHEEDLPEPGRPIAL